MENDERLLIVLVTYKTTLEQSSSYQTLLCHRHALTIPYQILIYNNSPEVKMHTEDDITIFTSGKNDMLSGAYNYALEEAQKKNFEWMMLLDQDSELTEEYLLMVNDKIQSHDSQVTAYVPSLAHNGRFISASVYNSEAGPFWGTKPAKSSDLKENQYITAVNSCSVIRTQALVSIGGFSEDFPLDYSDLWYYYQFYKKRYKIELLPIQMDHNLSILSLPDMGLERYKEYMKACARFSHKTQKSFVFYFRLRTFLRCFKFMLSPTRWEFIKPTFLALFE